MLHWQENLAGDECPPEWMWPFSKEVDDHLRKVEEGRKNPDRGDGKDLGGQVIEVESDLAAEMRRTVREGSA